MMKTAYIHVVRINVVSTRRLLQLNPRLVVWTHIAVAVLPQIFHS